MSKHDEKKEAVLCGAGGTFTGEELHFDGDGKTPKLQSLLFAERKAHIFAVVDADRAAGRAVGFEPPPRRLLASPGRPRGEILSQLFDASLHRTASECADGLVTFISLLRLEPKKRVLTEK